MADVLDEIRAVQAQAREAESKAHKANAAKEHAEAQIAALTKRLKDDHDIDSWEEASATVEVLNKQAAAALAEAKKILNGATE